MKLLNSIMLLVLLVTPAFSQFGDPVPEYPIVWGTNYEGHFWQHKIYAPNLTVEDNDNPADGTQRLVEVKWTIEAKCLKKDLTAVSAEFRVVVGSYTITNHSEFGSWQIPWVDTTGDGVNDSIDLQIWDHGQANVIGEFSIHDSGNNIITGDPAHNPRSGYGHYGIWLEGKFPTAGNTWIKIPHSEQFINVWADGSVTQSKQHPLDSVFGLPYLPDSPAAGGAGN